MDKRGYPSDLNDQEWKILEPLLPPPSKVGRPYKWDKRLIVNAIFYVLRTGCAWRYMPKDFPPWQTVYYHYYKWRRQTIWQPIHSLLRQRVRQKVGRNPEPSGAIIDSQSVKTTEQGGPRGFDGAKKVNGRKRHVLVDTTGLLLKAVVHPADIQDREGGKLLLKNVRKHLPRLNHIWADQGYTGQFKTWIETEQKVTLEVVYPWWRQIKRYFPDTYKELDIDKQFNVLPRRWVVERTFAWLGKQRRFSKDYERLAETSENLVYLGMTRLMLKRLARSAKA